MEHYKFKKGDKVRVTNSTGSKLKIGDKGIITEVDNDSVPYRVTVEGKENSGNWCREEDIELEDKMDEYEKQLREMVDLLRTTIEKMENIIGDNCQITSIDVGGMISSLQDDLHELEIKLHDTVN